MNFLNILISFTINIYNVFGSFRTPGQNTQAIVNIFSWTNPYSNRPFVVLGLDASHMAYLNK